MLTENEELYVKELFKEHEKWLAARNLDNLNLDIEDYKKEIEKIYGIDVSIKDGNNLFKHIKRF